MSSRNFSAPRKRTSIFRYCIAGFIVMCRRRGANISMPPWLKSYGRRSPCDAERCIRFASLTCKPCTAYSYTCEKPDPRYREVHWYRADPRSVLHARNKAALPRAFPPGPAHMRSRRSRHVRQSISMRQSVRCPRHSSIESEALRTEYLLPWFGLIGPIFEAMPSCLRGARGACSRAGLYLQESASFIRTLHPFLAAHRRRLGITFGDALGDPGGDFML